MKCEKGICGAHIAWASGRNRADKRDEVDTRKGVWVSAGRIHPVEPLKDQRRLCNAVTLVS